MSEKAIVDKEKIEKALLYTLGLTAEQAVLAAFDFPISLFATVFGVQRYLRNKERYVEIANEEGILNEQQTEYLSNADFYNQQKKKEHYLDTMQKLRKRLLCDMDYQINDRKDSGFVFSQPELLHYIWTNDYEEKLEELYYKYREEADGMCPAREEVPVEEQTISYASLYTWFLNHGVDIGAWNNLKDFQKQPIDKLQPLKKSRKSFSAERSKYVTYGAIIELFAKKLGGKFMLDKRINISQLAEYLVETKKEELHGQKRTVTKHINAAMTVYKSENKLV